MHTKINWFEIPSADFNRATKFYEALFDTRLKIEESGPVKMGIFVDASNDGCGCVAHSEHYTPGSDGTVIYLDAPPSIDKVIARIEPAGGRIQMEKMELPHGLGFIAHFIIRKAIGWRCTHWHKSARANGLDGHRCICQNTRVYSVPDPAANKNRPYPYLIHTDEQEQQMNYKGGCHCGRIAFEVEGDLAQVIECNCSHCSRKGYLLWFVPREQLRLATPESELAAYTFNKHVIKHHFCPNCGCAPFGFGADPSGAAKAAVNVRCLTGVEPSTLKIVPVDGRSF